MFHITLSFLSNFSISLTAFVLFIGFTSWLVKCELCLVLLLGIYLEPLVISWVPLFSPRSALKAVEENRVSKKWCLPSRHLHNSLENGF